MNSLIPEITKLDPYYKIFTDNSKTITFMLNHGLIFSEIPLRKPECNGITKVQTAFKFSDGMI